MNTYRRRRARRAAPALAWALLCVFAVAAWARPALAQTADTLDVNAKIHITTAGEPDESGDFVVDTNGDISMLYINQIHVAGLTVAQARDTITKALSKYYRNPQVVVTLLSPGGISVEVTGAVATQGAKLVRSDTRLNEVMSVSQPTVDADLTQVVVTHGRPGEPKTTDTVDYLSFVNDKKDEGNPVLKDGDKIYVPRKEALSIQANLRGQVEKPGRFPFPAKTTVFDAIEQQGGLTVSADKKKIFVVHAGSTQQIPFDYDAARQQIDNPQVNPVLQDGDTILVNATYKPRVYSITGAVHHPGEYQLTEEHVTLADAIGKAEGIAERARMKEAYIIRTGSDGKVTKIPIDASEATVQGATVIQPGDDIVIPQGRPGFSPNPLEILGTIGTLIAIFGRRR